jgi:hypothetical protein
MRSDARLLSKLASLWIVFEYLLPLWGLSSKTSLMYSRFDSKDAVFLWSNDASNVAASAYWSTHCYLALV